MLYRHTFDIINHLFYNWVESYKTANNRVGREAKKRYGPNTGD